MLLIILAIVVSYPVTLLVALIISYVYCRYSWNVKLNDPMVSEELKRMIRKNKSEHKFYTKEKAIMVALVLFALILAVYFLGSDREFVRR